MTIFIRQEFFNRPTLVVAEELLGKYLVLKNGDKFLINEVEAYDGPQDLACHASKGRTARTEIMFGPSGIFYVYLCYGMYWMLNIVTGPQDYPAAILIRGAGEYNGPGKLTKGLQINSSFNRKPAHPDTGLWFEDPRIHIKKSQILKTPRIGVNYAGKTWAEKKYRFLLK